MMSVTTVRAADSEPFVPASRVKLRSQHHLIFENKVYRVYVRNVVPVVPSLPISECAMMG